MKFKAVLGPKNSLWLTHDAQLKSHSENHLGLGYDRDELSLLGFNARLPDLGAPSPMDGCRRGDDGGSLLRTTNEIGFAFDGGRALGVLWQIDHGCRGTDGIREGHHGPPVNAAIDRAEIGTNQHLCHDAVLVGFDESHSLQFRKRNFHRAYLFKRRHGSVLPRGHSTMV